jgi:stage IV sporulation protein FB
MLHLGSIRGTTIAVDFSFLIIVALFVASAYDRNLGVHYALLWVPVLFVSVLIHELAHAAAIALFGYGSSEIVLGGMGGVTMNRRKARPWHDVVISVAGPLSSFGLAWLVTLIFYNVPITRQDPMLAALLPMLRQANIWWGIFNLLPVSPLDGGHAVRNFLRMFLTEKTSFVIAVWIAIVVGAGVAIAGFMFRMIFLGILIAWYVFMNYQSWQYYKEHGVPGE